MIQRARVKPSWLFDLRLSFGFSTSFRKTRDAACCQRYEAFVALAKLTLMCRLPCEMVLQNKQQGLTFVSDPTIKQLILRMAERQHDLIIEVRLLQTLDPLESAY